MKIFQLSILALAFLFQICISCKTTGKLSNKKADNLTACDSTKLELKYAGASIEENWLSNNEEDCSRMNEFFKMFGYSEDSKAYMKKFIKMKMDDDEYKLGRFIELYCLLNQNPNALIDGSLDKKNE